MKNIQKLLSNLKLHTYVYMYVYIFVSFLRPSSDQIALPGIGDANLIQSIVANGTVHGTKLLTNRQGHIFQRPRAWLTSNKIPTFPPYFYTFK